mgnify:FL=1
MSDVYEKACKVIDSCVSLEQLDVATRYVDLIESRVMRLSLYVKLDRKRGELCRALLC